MSTIVKGRLGYNLVEKRLLEHEFDIYTPILENTAIDCIVIKGHKLSRIQIKTVQFDNQGHGGIPVRKLSNNRGTNKQKLYSKLDVDFFIGVDLENNVTYVVPIDLVEQYTSTISISKLENYKEKYSLMEP